MEIGGNHSWLRCNKWASSGSEPWAGQWPSASCSTAAIPSPSTTSSPRRRRSSPAWVPPPPHHPGPSPRHRTWSSPCSPTPPSGEGDLGREWCAGGAEARGHCHRHEHHRPHNHQEGGGQSGRDGREDAGCPRWEELPRRRGWETHHHGGWRRGHLRRVPPQPGHRGCTAQNTINFTPLQLGSLTASMAFGALLGALLGGYYVDKIGRLRTFLLDLFFFIVAAVFAAFAPNLIWLLAFRFLMGVGVGLDFPVALSFIAEYTATQHKGRSVNLWQMTWHIAA